jgi:4-oxalocrotonate tautomerase
VKVEIMPHIQVHAIKDVFSKEQKKQVIQKLTDAMISIEGEKLRDYTLVTFHEVESGDWGVGGRLFTTSDVRSMQRGG